MAQTSGHHVTTYESLTAIQAEELNQYRTSKFLILATEFKHIKFPLKLVDKAIKQLKAYSNCPLLNRYIEIKQKELSFNGHWYD